MNVVLNTACAVVTAALITLAVVAPGAHADKLYPRCSAGELQAIASSGTTSDVGLRTPTPSNRLRITCLAFEVLSQSTTGGADACAIPHQTEYNYALYVQADFTDPATNAAASIDFSVKDVMGGSVNDILLSTPAEATFVLRFSNLMASGSTCRLKLRAVFEYEQVAATVAAGQATPPSLVAVSPSTVFASSAHDTLFVFRHTTVASAAADDHVKLVPATSSCASSDSVTLIVPATETQTQSVIAGYQHPGMHSVWAHHFEYSGAFKLCYKVATNTDFTESSLVSVFAGNPAYYQITAGAGPRGEVYLDTLTTVRFYGRGLDTRHAVGDKAKFVIDGESCEDGEAAGGVPVGTDLGPSDDYGPDCTFSDWSWRLQFPGSFKLCYQRVNHAWVEVPSISDLGPGAIAPATPVPAIPVPTPTNAQTHEACPTAAAGAADPGYSTNVKLTLAAPTVPSNYFRTLADILCLPRAAVTMTHVEPSGTAGQCNVFIDVLCNEADSAADCSSAERKNYLVEIASEMTHQAKTLLLVQAQIVRADGFVVEGLASPGGHGGHKGLVGILVIAVTIIAVTAIVTFGVLHYKQRQHYFVQFGQDEDEEVNIEIEDGGDAS